jgi:hypothetical protein
MRNFITVFFIVVMAFVAVAKNNVSRTIDCSSLENVLVFHGVGTAVGLALPGFEITAYDSLSAVIDAITSFTEYEILKNLIAKRDSIMNLTKEDCGDGEISIKLGNSTFSGKMLICWTRQEDSPRYYQTAWFDITSAKFADTTGNYWKQYRYAWRNYGLVSVLSLGKELPESCGTVPTDTIKTYTTRGPGNLMRMAVFNEANLDIDVSPSSVVIIEIFLNTPGETIPFEKRNLLKSEIIGQDGETRTDIVGPCRAKLVYTSWE